MSLEIDIRIDHPQWLAALPGIEDWCRKCALAALDGADLPELVEMSLVLADDDAVQALNKAWRGKDKPTNVLSFAALDDEDAPLPDGAPLLLGDVILAYQTCAAEAAEQDKTLSDHLAHLVVHGVLHLLGYDHEDSEDEAEEMEAEETAILAGLGIADPYAQQPSPAEGGRRGP